MVQSATPSKPGAAFEDDFQASITVDQSKVWGKLGIVNLTNGKTSVQEIPDEVRRTFLGGRGINVYYLYKLLPKDVDPLGPHNVLLYGAGLLTGTLAPSSSRSNVTAKSPESYVLGDGNLGGFWGSEMRHAGFDHLIVLGRAAKPSYIWLEDGRIEVRDAKDYWGLDSNAVQDAIKKDLGQCEMATIGVSGEKLVRFACVRSGLKRSARTGIGAVMGSKNLKAVVARGRAGIPIAKPLEYIKRANEIIKNIGDSKVSKVLGKYGTAFLYDTSNAIGAIRTKNSQLNQWTDVFNMEELHPYIDKMVSCSSCYVHCTHRNKLGGEGPEYSTTGIMGANLGIEKTEELVFLNNLCNQLGLDTSSCGAYLSWAIELQERGLISKELVGEKLEWGNFEQIVRLVHDIDMRRGFGDILAEGSQAIRLGHFPPEAVDYLTAVKGMPQSDPHDVRYLKSFGLGIATASRGADHLRSRPTLEIFMNLPMDVKEKIYGKGVTRDPTIYEGKAQTVTSSENIYAAGDALGTCRFVTHGFNSPHLLDFTMMRDLVNLQMGWNLTEEDVKQVGARTLDIERMFNWSVGVRRKDDTLPKRYFDDPMPLGIAAGHHIDRKQFQKMLDEYYALRGWVKGEGDVPAEKRQKFDALPVWVKGKEPSKEVLGVLA